MPQREFTRCYTCQHWGHHQSTCRLKARCGVCGGYHLTEVCLGRLKSGGRVPPYCINCGRGHHTWNPRCPARPLPPPPAEAATPAPAPAQPHLTREALGVILKDFTKGLATLLGKQVQDSELKDLINRTVHKQTVMLPRPLLLQQAEAPAPAPASPPPAPRRKLSLPAPLSQPGTPLPPKVQEAPCGVPSVSSPGSSLSPLSGGPPPDKRRRFNTSGTQTGERGRSSAASQTAVSTRDAATTTARTVTKDAATKTTTTMKNAASMTYNEDPSVVVIPITACSRDAAREKLRMLHDICEHQPKHQPPTIYIGWSCHKKDYESLKEYPYALSVLTGKPMKQ